MALKIDDIMELSLDDYIAISKKSNSDIRSSEHQRITFKSDSKDAKFGRRKGNIDDDEDDEDILMETIEEGLKEESHFEECDSGVWKGPDSSISYLDCVDIKHDLREKLNTCSKSTQKFSSVQYRMMAPNNAANRPRGMPTLVPLDVQVNNRNFGHNRGSNRNGGNKGNRGYNNFQWNFNSRKNNGNIYSNNPVKGVGNGRVGKNRKQDIEGKNLRFSIARNKQNFDTFANSRNTAQNMIIETPSSCINLRSNRPLNPSFQMTPCSSSEHSNYICSQTAIGNLTPQAEAVLNLNPTQNTSSNNESLKSLLGFKGNVSGEMMPIFASRLMDYIQNGLQNPVVHKPLYDMKIQKDIHEIQKKPLLYKCPGGEVVSSDGAGVNCKIIPRTSGVSLNCRFA